MMEIRLGNRIMNSISEKKMLKLENMFNTKNRHVVLPSFLVEYHIHGTVIAVNYHY